MTTGVFLEQIKQYESEVIGEDTAIKEKLQKMTAKYELASKKVMEFNNTEYLDFHARRLVEMAGNIIMGYLLVVNSQYDEKFSKSAKLFVNLASSENNEKFDYIDNFEIDNLELYKATGEEILQELELNIEED